MLLLTTHLKVNGHTNNLEVFILEWMVEVRKLRTTEVGFSTIHSKTSRKSLLNYVEGWLTLNKYFPSTPSAPDSGTTTDPPPHTTQPPPAPQATYTARIETGNVRGGGTKCKVSVRIYSSNDQLRPIDVLLSDDTASTKGTMKRGAVDVFIFEAEELGKLRKIFYWQNVSRVKIFAILRIFGSIAKAYPQTTSVICESFRWLEEGASEFELWWCTLR